MPDLSAVPTPACHALCLRQSALSGLCGTLFPALHDGVFPVWRAHDHGLFLSGHREAGPLAADPAGPAGRPIDPTGTAAVPPLGIGRCAFRCTYCGRSDLCAVRHHGILGVPGMEKARMVG